MFRARARVGLGKFAKGRFAKVGVLLLILNEIRGLIVVVSILSANGWRLPTLG